MKPDKGLRAAARFVKSQSAFTAFLIVSIVAALLYEPFTTYQNISNILMQISYTGIMAVGMTFVILSGGIDLSVSSTVVITAILASRASILGLPVVVSLVLPLLTGLVIGFINGLFVAKLQIPPFIATLAMMLAARGAAFLITIQSVDKIISQDGAFRQIAAINIFGIPLFSLIFLLLAVLGGLMLKFTRIGRWFYAVGGNEDAARMMGLDSALIKITAYVICGLLSGAAGLLLASRTGLPQANAAQGWEMNAIAAVVLGGTVLSGGQGKMSGTFFGALILGVVSNIINLEPALSTYAGNIVTGLILLAVVVIQALTRKAQMRE